MRIWSFIGAIIGILLTLGACLPKVEVPPLGPSCVMPELRERALLPGVEWLPQGQCGEGDRCLSEPQYQELKRLVSLLRSYEVYLIESYNNARTRCGGEK